MTLPENTSRFRELATELESDPEHLTGVEAHGLLCAMAVHPAPPADWQEIAAGEGKPLDSEMCRLLEKERQRLAARLGVGERVQLPCRLDPYEEREGEDLAAWCTGFMAGVMATGGDWPEESSDDDGDSPLLPFLLISGLDEDPALDELWQDEKLVRQMARSLPELLEELFLRLQAPEAGAQEERSS